MNVTICLGQDRVDFFSAASSFGLVNLSIGVGEATFRVLNLVCEDAETRASMWIANGNEAKEAGHILKADRCSQKASPGQIAQAC
jgi:hypothetical protein